jgi:hypothetical protein
MIDMRVSFACPTGKSAMMGFIFPGDEGGVDAGHRHMRGFEI